MSYKHYSLALGRSYNYLAVLKKQNKDIAHLSPFELFNLVKKREIEQELLIERLQQAYYWLVERELLMDFSEKLTQLKITKSVSVWIFRDSFKVRSTLRPKSFAKFNQVLQEFEIYKTKYKCLKLGDDK